MESNCHNCGAPLATKIHCEYCGTNYFEPPNCASYRIPMVSGLTAQTATGTHFATLRRSPDFWQTIVQSGIALLGGYVGH